MPADTSPALLKVSTDDLEHLAKAIGRGDIEMPFRAPALHYQGKKALAEAMAPFDGLSGDAVLAVLNAVLGERKRAAARTMELVWSGSDAGVAFARYTPEVIRELIGRARNLVTIAGYSFDEGTDVFELLHEAMTAHGVAVRLFLDIDQLSRRLQYSLRKSKRSQRLGPLRQARNAGPMQFAKEVLSIFREVHWPFDSAPPKLYYDPRTADPTVFASLHAKCLVVDGADVLITSANFTGRGQERNIEAGVVIRDKAYATALERQWNNLVESGDVVKG